MFKVGDIVKIRDFAKISNWFNHDYYKVIDTDRDVLILYNINKDKPDAIHNEYLEIAIKEYRKQKLKKIENDIRKITKK